MPRWGNGASLALVGIVLLGTAAAAAPEGGAPPGAIDRAASCATIVDVECKDYVFCQKHRLLDGEEHKDYAGCMHDIGWSACERHGDQRPLGPTASAADFHVCLSAFQALPKNKDTCAALFDERNWPLDCQSFAAEAQAQDYAPAPGTPCAPGYSLDAGAACRLACASDADCRPKYEACGDDGHPHVCVTAKRTPPSFK